MKKYCEGKVWKASGILKNELIKIIIRNNNKLLMNWWNRSWISNSISSRNSSLNHIRIKNDGVPFA